MAKFVPRWAQLSLRNQLTTVNFVLLAFCLVLAGIGTTLLLRPTLVGQLDASLRQIAADPGMIIDGGGVENRVTYEGVLTAPQQFYVAVVDDSGEVLVDNWTSRSRSLAPQVGGLARVSPADAAQYTVYGISDGLGAPWRGVVVPRDRYLGYETAGTLIVAVPTSSVNTTMASFLGIFLGFGISMLVFVIALTRLLVTITLQPLSQVESTAMAFAAGDYDRRLPTTTPNTEVGRLSRSLNIMLSRIDSALDERERTIEQMRRFVGDASHELRTPLVTVRGYAELYRMGALPNDEAVATAFARIESEAKRMGGLVEDLLQLARLDESRKLSMDAIDLEPLVRDAVLDTTAQAPDRTVRMLPTRVLTASDDEAPDSEGSEPDDGDGPGATGTDRRGRSTTRQRPKWLRLRRRDDESSAAKAADASEDPSTSEGVAGLELARTGAISIVPGAGDTSDAKRVREHPARILGNTDKVRQAVQNIIGNALRYTPEGSPIELGVVVDPEARTATVDIIDHGDGIPENERQKIFQRFWRSDSSRTRETGGSGLGLAIVSAIMTAHRGRVEVVDTSGGGATFRLGFPLAGTPGSEGERSSDGGDASTTVETRPVEGGQSTGTGPASA